MKTTNKKEVKLIITHEYLDKDETVIDKKVENTSMYNIIDAMDWMYRITTELGASQIDRNTYVTYLADEHDCDICEKITWRIEA